jgi:hypothetical protein
VSLALDLATEGRTKLMRSCHRIHAASPRDIINGQYIHRSVQKRLRYDHSLVGKHALEGYVKYDGPKARVPEDWGVDWADLRDGKGPIVWED